MNKQLKRFLRVATLACAVTLSVGFVADQAQAKDYYALNNARGDQIYIVGSQPIYTSNSSYGTRYVVTVKVVNGSQVHAYKIELLPDRNGSYYVLRDGLTFASNERNEIFHQAVLQVYRNQQNGIY